MRRWLPHIHAGGSSEECTRDHEGGREGWYVNVCWLGFLVSFGVSSVYAERRMMEEIRKEREAAKRVCGYCRADFSGDEALQTHTLEAHR